MKVYLLYFVGGGDDEEAAECVAVKLNEEDARAQVAKWHKECDERFALDYPEPDADELEMLAREKSWMFYKEMDAE
jgi:hypothetical protein